MRILFIDLGSAWGGAERYLASLMDAARSQGEWVACASPHYQHRKHANMHTEIPISYGTFPDIVRTICAICHDKAIGLIHLNAARASYLAPLLRPLGIPIVATRHSLSQASTGGQVRQWTNRWLSSVCYRAAHKVICVSDSVRSELPARIGHKAVVIENGVTGPDAVKFDLPPHGTLGYVGRLVADKGILDFLSMARQFAEREPRASTRFVIAGTGPEATAVEKFALHTPSLSYLGFCSQLEEVYPSLSALVLPSRAEGMPLAVLEAFSHGRAAIGYDVPGIRDVIDHGQTGYLVPLESGVDGLVAAADTLLKDPDNLLRMMHNARATYERRFRLDLMVDRTLELFREAAR